ncbi:hypothetical protein D3C71_1419610 [compost metagenome]
MMKSRTCSISWRLTSLYSVRSAGLMPSKGNSWIRRTTALMVRWMLVDSSGSMKPLASPSATTFLFQAFNRRPLRNGTSQGSRSGGPSTSPSSLACASSSDMCRLENTSPQPTRCCSAICHRHPASWAMARVYGTGGATDSVCTATARSLGNHSCQSSYPVCRVCSVSRPRKPVQSMNRSPSMTCPSSSTRDATAPSSGCCLTSRIFPSTRRRPWASALRRRNRA